MVIGAPGMMMARIDKKPQACKVLAGLIHIAHGH